MRSRSTHCLITVLFGACSLAACQGTIAGFGNTPDQAQANASGFFTGLAERFTNVERTPTLEASDLKIVHAALAPSRVYNDSVIWTSSNDSRRTLTIAGTFTNGHYLFVPHHNVPLPLQHLGDGRDEIALTRLAPDTYEWTTHVLSAVGTVTGADLVHAFDATLAATATHSSPELLTGIHTVFPRTTAVLSKLYAIDSLTVTSLPGNTAAVHLAVSIRPDTLARTDPHFGAYLGKYLGRSRAHCVLADATGMPWGDLAIEHNHLSLTIHTTRDGHLAPFSGPPRPLPDTMRLTSDLHTRAWIFGIGASNLVASVITLHDDHTHGWRLQWQQEPDWHFPLLVEHLIKSPLRRPFTDTGLVFQIALQDSANAQSQLTRDARVAVQESAIASWLGGLGGNALGALSGQTGVEMNSYFAEIFSALNADVTTDK